jgi:hypothetical protein
MLISLIPCPPKSAKHNDKAWHTAVGTVVFELRHLVITGPDCKWACTDGFQRQYYTLLATCVRDYPVQVMLGQVSSGSCPMCDIPKCAPMGNSLFCPLDNSSKQQLYLEVLEEGNIDALYTLCVSTICNQFWQYPLHNI